MFTLVQRITTGILILALAGLSHAGRPASLPEQARVELDGTLEVFIREDLGRGTAAHEYFLDRGPGAVPIRLLFANGTPSHMRSGIGIAVRGTVRNGRVEVDSVNYDAATSGSTSGGSESSSGAEAAVLDQRTALVVVVNLSDVAHSATDLANMQNYYFGNSQSMKDMYDQISFGQLDIIGDVDDANGDGSASPDGTPDVFGPIQSSRSAAEVCDNPFPFASEFLAAAEGLGVDPELYQHRIFAVPRSMSCGWTGYANVGCGSACSAFNRWSHDINTTSHEMGHNLGLAHAGKDTDGNGVLEGGEQYSDFSSFMGYSLSNGVRALDGAHHWQTGWYPDYDSQTTNLVTASGQYSLAPLQEGQPSTIAPSILRIDVSNGRPYFLSAREPQGYDTDLASLNSAALDGVNIHRYNGSGYDKTWLIDQLAAGQSYNDGDNNLTVTQVGGKDANGTVTVNIDLGQGECIESAPGLGLNPSFATVGPNSSYNFVATLTNNDGTSCGQRSFTLVENGQAFANLSIAAGSQDSASRSISGGATSGDINFTVSVLNYPGVTAEGTLTVDADPPAEVTNLSGTYVKKGKNRRIRLNWDGSSSPDVASYQVHRDGNLVGTTSQDTYTDNLSGTIEASYLYNVVAVDAYGNASSGVSTPVSTSDDGGGGGGGNGNGGGNGGGRGGPKPR